MRSRDDHWTKCSELESKQLFFLMEEIVEELADNEFSNTPAPSENIWKKFELLPTPPRSPSRDQLYLLEKNLGLDFEEKQNNAGDFNPEETTDDIETYFGLVNPCKLRAGLKNELAHDCMWSGSCRKICKQFRNIDSEVDLHSDSEQLVVQQSDAVCDRLAVPASHSKSTSSPQSGALPSNKVDLSNVEVVPKDCADPSSVLPYSPFSDHCYHQPTRLQGGQCCVDHREVSPITRQRHNLRDHVANDTPSDSDDDIDVVTVPAGRRQQQQQQQQQQQKRRPGRRKGCLTTKASRGVFRARARAAPRKRVVPVSKQIQLKKRTAKRQIGLEDEEFPNIPESQKKWMFESYSSSDEMKFTGHMQGSEKMSCSSSSRSSSDSEDTEKRSQHNNMERKRRDDLRYSFQRLRDYVPELQGNTRAPKVMILNKAAMYCKQLTSMGMSLERTMKTENRRRAELQKRLLQLQRFH